MMNSCKNCLYCDIQENDEYHTPDGHIYYGLGLKTYVCMKDMFFKEPKYICDKWEHKCCIFRFINKLREYL